MKIAYMLANLVRDVNSVMDITTHPRCVSEDQKAERFARLTLLLFYSDYQICMPFHYNQLDAVV